MAIPPPSTTLTPSTRPVSAARTASVPLVVAHRGASGYRPEHTLAGYELAARMGADSLEPDLVSSADGELICLHDLGLARTTDVVDHPEFADRRTERTIEGRVVRDWFVSDFTLRELKTLSVRERHATLRQSNTVYDGRFRIATFAELLRLRARLSDELGHPIGLSPELKQPQLHRVLGLDIEAMLVAALRAAGLDRDDAPVFVQTFEPTSLSRLRREHGLRAPTLLLTDTDMAPPDLPDPARRAAFGEILRPRGLRQIAQWATAIGPAKDQVIPRRPDGSLRGPTSLVRDAHNAGLRVHVWTFRAENAFLPADYRKGADADFGDVLGEMAVFLRAGVDALITDQPDLALLARSEVFVG